MNTKVKCRSSSWPATKELLTCSGLRSPCCSRGSPFSSAGAGCPQRWPWSMKHLPGECFVPSSISITISRDDAESCVDALEFQTELVSSTSHTDLLLGNSEQECQVLNSLSVILGPCGAAACTTCPTTDGGSSSKCLCPGFKYRK